MNFQPLCYQPNEAFEGRNKSYGAYVMRKIYQKRVITSLFFAVFTFTVAMGAPLLYYRFVSDATHKPNLDKRVMTDVPPPVEKPKVVPPVTPPPPIEQPKIAQAKFLPPTPANDKEVTEDLAKQEDLKDKQISTKNQDGNPDEGDIAPPAPVTTLPPVVEKVEEDKNKIYVVVQKQASFPDGQEAMAKFLRKHFKYPRAAHKMGVEGRVYLRFVVRKDGSIDDISVQKGIKGCEECDTEAVRLIRLMPKWTPAEQNGNTVNVYFSLPIVFKIQD